MTRTAALPVEGAFPSLDGATAWLNSGSLTPADLRGTVVAVQFGTFSCINWLRTLPYVEAWAEKYRGDGLVVICVHSPEFPFEHDLGNVRSALDPMGVVHPVAVDNDFTIWRAFENHSWPALFLVDAQGRIRYHHFGEEAYERSERVIQHLLAEAGSAGVGEDLAPVEADGVYLAADRDRLGSPETYLGYGRATGSPRPGASGTTGAGPTPSRRASHSTAGRSPVTGRSGSSPSSSGTLAAGSCTGSGAGTSTS